MCLDDHADDPDFVSRMRAALPRPLEPPVAGAPPTYHDMEQAVKGAPRPRPSTNCRAPCRLLLSALPGCGLRILVGVLEYLASGTPAGYSRQYSTSASPRSSRRGWCATIGPSCWSPTSCS